MFTGSTLDTWKVCQDSSNKKMKLFTRLKSRTFFLEIRNQTQKENRKILKRMEIKHPRTQSVSKQKSQKKLKHLETNVNKEKFVKLEDI